MVHFAQTGSIFPLVRPKFSGPHVRSSRQLGCAVQVRRLTNPDISQLACRPWVYPRKVVSHATNRSVLRSQKSWNRPLSFEQRSAMMALEPRTVQCMPARFKRVPIATLHPASTTPVEVHKP